MALATHWTPSPADLSWMHQLVNTVRDGGYWGTTWATFKLDHTNRQVALVRRHEGCTKADSEENIARIRVAFEAIGWSMIDPDLH